MSGRSSTTNTWPLTLVRGASRRTAESWRTINVGESVSDSATGPTGNSTVNRLPTSGTDSTVRSPPISRASRRLIASPNPVPPKFRETVPSAWVNGSNNAWSFAGSMPMPVSATVTRMASPSPPRSNETSIVTPPARVNLMALPTRLIRICLSLRGSVRI